MKKIQKLEMMELQDKDASAWISTHREAHDEMSKKYSILCICGRLCTRFHESQCVRFKDAVNLRTITKLKQLESKK